MPLAGVAVIGRLEHMLGTANDSVELEGETFHADEVAPVGGRKAARWRINLLDDALAGGEKTSGAFFFFKIYIRCLF